MNKTILNKTYNTKTWLIWFLAALTVVFLAKNPFYLGLVVFIITMVFFIFRTKGEDNKIWKTYVRAGLILIFLSIIYNTFTVHYGDTILFSLNHKIPVIGGNITLEAIIYGALFGIVFLSMLCLFAVLSVVTDSYRILRLTPSVLRETAVIISIAMNFVPQTISQAREIKEAQLIRGVNFNGGVIKKVRNYSAMLLPVLITGLERALTVSESMDSRGFGGIKEQSSLREKILILIALLILFIGIIMLFMHLIIGYLVAGLGGVSALLVLLRKSRKNQSSQYKRELWQKKDTLLVSASVFIILFFLIVSFTEPSLLNYYPYPRLFLPEFNLYIGIVIVLLILPVVFVYDNF